LIPGDGATPVADAIRTMPPSPVPLGAIADDGLLTTRIVIVPAPDASVGALNAVLEANGARVVSMREGLPVLTLVVPPVADGDAALALANALASTDPILLAFPSREVRPVLPDLEEPPTPGDAAARVEEMPPHLAAMRIPAAWNARRLAEETATEVTVIVPDGYQQLTPHPDIPTQLFLGGPGQAITAPAPDGVHYGNHGFHVSGILGASPASTSYSGVHPAPDGLIEIRSMPVGGLTFPEVLSEIGNLVPGAGHAVISSSIGYGDPRFQHVSKIQRAIDAATWRLVVSEYATQVYHATAAGNDGEVEGDGSHSRYSSAFTVSAAYSDLQVLADEDSTASAAQKLELALLLAAYPETSIHPRNVHRVGSSSLDGGESAFSGTGSDLRVVGRSIPGPCVIEDPSHGTNPFDCDGTLARYSGTSMATPQVAGLAAYLWNLSPTRTPVEIADILDVAYGSSGTPGILDAYAAVLALDHSMDDPRVRLALLDVADGSGAPGANGRFDEHDLRLFLDGFDAHGGHRGSEPDHSRFDLNGDGYTGAVGFERFDLDVNPVPQYTTVSQNVEGRDTTFDETGVDDREILCYYAYSSLYQGDPDLRRQYFAGHAPPERFLLVTFEWGYVVYEGYASPLRIRAGYITGVDSEERGGVEWTAGIDVSVAVTDGAASVTSGETDADGWFVTDVTANPGVEEIHVNVDVDDGLGQTELLSMSGNVRFAGVVAEIGGLSATIEHQGRIRSPSGAQGALLFDEFESDRADFFDGDDGSLTFERNNAGSFDHGEAVLQGRANATLSGSTTVTGTPAAMSMAIDVTVTSSATIKNAPADDSYWSWYARSCSHMGGQQDFRVEGLPARVTVTLGYPDRGHLGFTGGGVTYVCYSGLYGHCGDEAAEWTTGEDGTVIWTGVLPPGSYTFYAAGAYGSPDCVLVGNETDPDSGTVSESQTASIRLEVESIPPGEARSMGWVPSR
jgi:hypothetical protein